jgi:hypothetical protein
MMFFEARRRMYRAQLARLLLHAELTILLCKRQKDFLTLLRYDE